MTLTIKLTAENSVGINFNSIMVSYFADFKPAGFPYILGGSGFKGDQIVLVDETEAQPETTKAIVLDGSNFEYYFSGHTLSGTLTKVRLATLGDSYNSNGSFDIVGNHVANISTAVEISGLLISNAQNVRGNFHNTVAGLMGGGHEGGFANPATLNTFVWAQAHNVIGSTAADVYGGTKFGDTVRGNGGNDRLDGKLGSDTAVFSGTRASYSIVKQSNGSVVVTDLRGGSPDGADTLTNFELARFSNALFDLKTFKQYSAPHTLALSKLTVTENLPVGSTIAIVSAKDNEGGALTYKLLSSTGGYLKLVGNRLQVAKPIDYEKLASAVALIEVKDTTGLATRKSFSIAVLDVAERILGTSGADALNGGRGRDLIYGLNGNDTLRGNAGNDALFGGLHGDTLYGHAGNDVLDGGPGLDRAYGWLGNDIFRVDSTGDRAYESANQGTDHVLATASFVLGSNVEHLTLLGAAHLNGTGNGLANLITGNAGRNILKGGAGNDTLRGGGGDDRLFGEAGNDTLDGGTGINLMYGGVGDDRYYLRTNNDKVFEVFNQGVDTVLAYISHTLSGNVENLTLVGPGNLNGTGNTLNNVIIGNGGNNTLAGGTGDDTLIGGAGTDTLRGDGGADRIFAKSGDTVDGGADDDFITLAGATPVIAGLFDGGSGTDTLVFTGAGFTANLSGTGGTRFTHIEAIDITGTGDNALVFDAADVIAFSDTAHAGFVGAASTDNLVIRGNAGDSVDISDLGLVGWVQNGTTTIGADTFNVYELNDGGAILAAVAVQTGVQWII